MPLSGSGTPARPHSMGLVFDMVHHLGTVRCHVMREAFDHLGADQARTDDDVMARFGRNRAMFEALASKLHDAGHRSPWIMVEHVIGSPPDDE